MERKWAMTKIGKGDWLCPSNDGRTMWRFSTYTDGPSLGLVGARVDRDYWMASSMPIENVQRWLDDAIDDGYYDMDGWTIMADTMRSRKEAIAEMMRQEGEG